MVVGVLRVGGLGVCCSRPWWAGGLGKQGLRGDLLRVGGLGVCCSRPWWAGGLGKQGLRGDLGGCNLSLGVWGCEFGGQGAGPEAFFCVYSVCFVCLYRFLNLIFPLLL